MKYIPVIAGLLIILSSCKPATKNVVNAAVKDLKVNDTSSIRKRLERSRKQADDNYEILFNNDTLKIVSVMDYLYYPFGVHVDAGDIAKQVTEATLKKIKLRSFGTGDSTDIIQITTSKSQMKLLYDDEQKRQQIVSAEIYDNNFHLKKNIQIGMTKTKFLSVFFKNPPVILPDIIKFISAVDGIKHYYYFKNNKLSEIIMVTDYTLENK